MQRPPSQAPTAGSTLPPEPSPPLPQAAHCSCLPALAAPGIRREQLQSRLGKHPGSGRPRPQLLTLFLPLTIMIYLLQISLTELRRDGLEEFNFFFPRKPWAPCANPLVPQWPGLHSEVSVTFTYLSLGAFLSSLYIFRGDRRVIFLRTKTPDFKVTSRHEIHTKVREIQTQL